ncbi:light-harvesting complex-like protein OHP1, chloroplastic isoform X1 [Chenopodium quinoa]|uniref:light-harvesting complex-like protein OHP1, chloroplastic isoform X1 n=1 Tax=Chenopodium quinoa TaxID=63459 RepID=UPI000B78B3C5|nr:light-harvesting complex-like protein OHP1, chloroplastic isoform X1 [Chenopodium quinoa]
MASVALFNSQFLVNPLKQPQPAAAASNLSLLPPSGRRLRHRNHGAGTNHGAFRVRAAKPPAGVVVPKVEPKFKPSFLGFTKTAEIWNSRACMIGLIGTFIVELILNKGILQLIGIEIGKGLDIPL